jgi:hypothetical protein
MFISFLPCTFPIPFICLSYHSSPCVLAMARLIFPKQERNWLFFVYRCFTYPFINKKEQISHPLYFISILVPNFWSLFLNLWTICTGTIKLMQSFYHLLRKFIANIVFRHVCIQSMHEGLLTVSIVCWCVVTVLWMNIC